MPSITITLPQDRLTLGQLFVLDDDGVAILGPIPCDGKSDNQAAAANGNPTRDPARPYGDTPCGAFSAHVGHEPDTPANTRSYGAVDATGAIPVVWLAPLRGDGTSQAWQRQACEDEQAGHAVDMGLAIHSGPPNSLGQLRVTHGCVRISQADIINVLAAVDVGQFGVTIGERP